MTRLNRLIHAALLVFAAGGTLAAPAEGLVVRLSSPAPLLRGDVDVAITVTVTNVTRAAITLLRWELPSARAENASFRITRDGQPVAYTGPLIKRAAPTERDYVRIEAGATLTYTVELTQAYDLSRNGTYTIEYASQGATAGTALRSDPMYLWLESRSGIGAVVPATVPAAVVPGTQAITFTGCSTSQQTQATTAAADALTYANGAVSYYAGARAATQRFIKWFGPGSRGSWTIARTHYAAIQDAFATKPLAMDCSCNESGVYAYVFANAPYKIYLCPVFWTAPATGTDSKAGTLIHEMSHFTVVAGTSDHVYGQSGAAALAISNPAFALDNADNHEYFAENTPTLP